MIETGQATARQHSRRSIPYGARESRWRAPGGADVRRIDWGEGSATRGSILFLPGRGDFYEKYLESLGEWHAAGWRVTASDWRGQAGSGRLGIDPLTGHVADFADWVRDLAALWVEWKATTPAPHVLIGHSMGGHLALRAVVEGKVDPTALVLSAPMLGFVGQPLPPAVMHTIARVMRALGDPRRPAWKWSEKPGVLPTTRAALLTHDEDRYEDEIAWRETRPELAMGPGSWGWVERAMASMRALAAPGVLEKVDLPVLLIATRVDRLVSFAAIERAAERLPHAELVAFGEEARHEILREADPVRDRAMETIADFLAREAPAPR